MIDGDSFFELCKDSLQQIGIKLGPSLKIQKLIEKYKPKEQLTEILRLVSTYYSNNVLKESL